MKPSIQDVQQRILDALGLKENNITGVDISLNYGKWPSVTVTFDVDAERLDALAPVLRGLVLVPKEPT